MIIDCLGKAIFMFAVYNIIALLLFGVPKSLSDTYYLFKERKVSFKSCPNCAIWAWSLFPLRGGGN